MARRVLFLLILIAVGWLVYTVSRTHPTPKPAPSGPVAVAQPTPTTKPPRSPAGASPAAPASAPVAPTSVPAPQPATQSTNPPVVPAPVVIPSSPEGQPTNLAPMTVLENMRTTIRQFGSMFGGNPVGTNPEITRALAGDNPKQINFLKADGNRINSQGELIDPWGTPYFFHQLSGTEMEIRSAGPDRVMYTSDDLIIK